LLVSGPVRLAGPVPGLQAAARTNSWSSRANAFQPTLMLPRLTLPNTELGQFVYS
jgi:hypothetical protein